MKHSLTFLQDASSSATSSAMPGSTSRRCTVIRLNAVVCALTAGIVFSAASLFAQPPVPRPGVIPRPAPRPRQFPCWEQAGISKAAIEQRRQIERTARAQVEAVCAESGLSMQQKREKIREIRQRARQETESLITPQQQEALRACQRERSGGGHPGRGGHGGGGMGPCGEMPAPKVPAPQHEEPQ
jgi:hypothetical protein